MLLSETEGIAPPADLICLSVLSNVLACSQDTPLLIIKDSLSLRGLVFQAKVQHTQGDHTCSTPEYVFLTRKIVSEP